MTLREYDTVRVARLLIPNRPFDGTRSVMRAPAVGDVGTICHESSAADSEAVVVEMVDADGLTIWLADFQRSELELVVRPSRVSHTDPAVALAVIEEQLRQWDPIGVIPDLLGDGLPPDEYDSYAPYIANMLARGTTVDALTAHLEYCRTGAMGLPSDPTADRAAAEELMRAWADRGNTAVPSATNDPPVAI
jgi:hypothetical protein